MFKYYVCVAAVVAFQFQSFTSTYVILFRCWLWHQYNSCSSEFHVLSGFGEQVIYIFIHIIYKKIGLF